MNRRQILIGFSIQALVPKITPALSKSTPPATPLSSTYSPFISPKAVRVTQTLFRLNRTETTDVVRVPYLVFEFGSDEAASESYVQVLSNVSESRARDAEFESDWHEEISIGDIGDDRLGYLQKDEMRIYGLVVKDNFMAQFTVVAPNPIASFSTILQSVIEDAETLDLSLSDFPPGWQYEIEPTDVTERFTILPHQLATSLSH